MRVIVFGAAGMLGHLLLRVLAETPGIEVVATLRQNAAPRPLADQTGKLIHGINIGDTQAVAELMRNWRPDAVVNCVAARAPDAGPAGMAEFLYANAVWPHRLAALADSSSCRMIHISSDGVFSGQQGDYVEDDKPDPPNAYCMAKLLGESAGSNVVTLRTSIIGPELGAGDGLVSWFLRQSAAVNGYSQWMFSGFTTLELSRIIAHHILPNPLLSGLYHVASPAISKLDILRLLAKSYGHNVPINADDSIWINRTLNGARFATQTGYVAPSWPEMIGAMRDYGP